MSLYLGVEFGSTRIKAVGINENYEVVNKGDYLWKSDFINGIWTYSLDEAIKGLKEALLPFKGQKIDVMGISGMMHGYLAFDENWNLLVPFRTWQNTITKDAADILTKRFNFNIPQRWSIAHLYQAILNKEEHINKIAHITTLAGYMHYLLTGVNAVGIGEASGIFPIDSAINNYDKEMINSFNELLKENNLSYKLEDILPKVLIAGEDAGRVSKQGSLLVENIIEEGIQTVPCEGDAGTGMVATNSIKIKTGNVSAGTSIFAMVVLENALKNYHSEIDIVTTPIGKQVAMVHCNNCTNDFNEWMTVFIEVLSLYKKDVPIDELFSKLYLKSLEGDMDCSDVLSINYLAGEAITGFESGRPLIIRKPDSKFNLANFMRSQLYATMATLKIGMDILKKENIEINSLMGHGGLFKTEGVCSKYLAAACDCEVSTMSTSGEGGPYGMAILASYKDHIDTTLEEYLDKKVFANCKKQTVTASKEEIEAFNQYLDKYKKCLEVEKKAVDNLL